jgi:hypothetical protein
MDISILIVICVAVYRNSPCRLLALLRRSAAGQSTTALPGYFTDLDFLCDLKGIVNLDAKVADGALDLCVAQ